MSIKKSIKYGRENGEVIDITEGDFIAVTTFKEVVVGKLTKIAENYIELLVAKHNVNQYMSLLIVGIKDIEILEED